MSCQNLKLPPTKHQMLEIFVFGRKMPQNNNLPVRQANDLFKKISWMSGSAIKYLVYLRDKLMVYWM